ncbi:MAG: hypothetical protein H0X47_16010 [Nitrospirales bacterium]|nr:hypothetical protein [Nitrospirales bacterium]
MSCRLNNFAFYRKGCPGLAGVMVLTVFVYSLAEAAPIAVQFREGVAHGFLLVRSLAGEVVGQGEMTQVVKEGDLVESRLVFNFKDGSLHDEKVAFSQQHVFTLISYRLVQHGPSFPEQIDVAFDRGSGEYRVRSKAGENGKEEVMTGVFDFPKDVYNGMMITVLLSLPQGASETVNVLAFTPSPEIIKLELSSGREDIVYVGDLSRKALQYEFKPDIGLIREFFGKAIGKLPAQFHYHCWILADKVPSFLQFQGPLQLMGPILRIALVSPRLASTPEDNTMSLK